MDNQSLNLNEVDLKKIILIFWGKKFTIISITFVAAILSVFYALSLPNIYKSQSTLVPASQEDSLTSKLGGLSSLAGIVGVSLPSSSSKSQEGMERIKSFEFFSNYFLPNIKLENIMAVKKWIPEENIIIYDDSLFDERTNKWVRKVRFPKQPKPSSQEAYEIYEEILSISEDRETAFVSISIEHRSPIIAHKWLKLIINQINESMREVDSKKARNSISFLNEASKSTNVQSVRNAISKLLENQMQILMLAGSNQAYIFETIDSPIVPEKKFRPSRAVICIIGTFLGGLLSLLIAYILYYRESSNS
jgi:capsular polysaccharide biosynthesis protein